MKTLRNKAVEIINEKFGENAQYILATVPVEDKLERLDWVERKEEKSQRVIDMWMKDAIEMAEIMNDRILTPANAEIGDGATLRMYSDCEAYTIIKKTKCSVTIQRDKATLDPNFKPEFAVGGFCAHCTNQEEQTWLYERDENGYIETYRWSKKNNRYQNANGSYLFKGRHEFYDYNF